MTSAAQHDPDKGPCSPVGSQPAATSDGPPRGHAPAGGLAGGTGWAVPGVTGLGSGEDGLGSGQVRAGQPAWTQPPVERDVAGESGWGRAAPAEVLQAPVRESITDLIGSVDEVLACGRPDGAGADSPSAEAEIAVLATQLTRLQAALLDRLASIDASGSWATDASPSLRVWVAARTRSTLEVAGEQVRLARSLPSKPLLAAALRTGTIRPEHAVEAARAMDKLAAQLPDRPDSTDSDSDSDDDLPGADAVQQEGWSDPQHVLDEVEPALVTLAEHLDPRAFGVEVRRRTAALLPLPHHKDTADLDKARRLHLRQDQDGGWSGTFRYGPEDGALLETARAAWRATDHSQGDERTPAQRDADALTGLVRRAIDTGLPVQHGIRPHLIVLTPYDTWTAAHTSPASGNSGSPDSSNTADRTGPNGHGAGATSSDPLGLTRAGGLQPATTLGGEPLTLPALRRLSCDARITRLVLSPDGQPLDVGRTTRTIGPAIWLAALARDRGCAIRGCQQGPERCEGHHAKPYSQGGQTSIDNIHLLCTGTHGHHHQIHDHGRTLQLDDGRWIGPHGFTDPPDRPPT